MVKIFELLLTLMVFLSFTGCTDRLALAESSFGKVENPKSKASPFSVISMGRDDDDGKAKKWHIGGRE